MRLLTRATSLEVEPRPPACSTSDYTKMRISLPIQAEVGELFCDEPDHPLGAVLLYQPVQVQTLNADGSSTSHLATHSCGGKLTMLPKLESGLPFSQTWAYVTDWNGIQQANSACNPA